MVWRTVEQAVKYQHHIKKNAANSCGEKYLEEMREHLLRIPPLGTVLLTAYNKRFAIAHNYVIRGLTIARSSVQGSCDLCLARPTGAFRTCFMALALPDHVI